VKALVLDTSAVLALLQGEKEADRILAALADAEVRRVSAATVVEAGIVLQARYGDHGERELDLFLERAEVEVIPFSEEHATVARQAFRRFGKGRHPAALNFGDCFVYALAVVLDHPLLFVGTDFSATDVPRLE